MKRLPTSVLTLLVGLLISPGPVAFAEDEESSGVQQITVEKVGPYEPTSKADLSQVASQIIEQTNAFRKSKELAALSIDKTLTQTAKEFASYMARTGRYGHNADEQTPAERAKAEDYELCLIAENIAYQFRTTGFKTEPLAKRFVTGWKESPGHRKNMLRESVTETGVAVVQSETTGVYFAVQLFGRPKSEAIVFQVTNRTEQDIQYRINRRKFSLPSRFTRSHQQCLPGQIEFLSASESNEAAQPVSKIKLKTQTKIIVTSGSDGQLKVDVEELEEGEAIAKPDESDVSN